MISANFGASTRYVHSDLSLYTLVRVASNQDRPCDIVMIESLILGLDIIKPLCQKTTEGARIMKMVVSVVKIDWPTLELLPLT